jgi:hypothetical protein
VTFTPGYLSSPTAAQWASVSQRTVKRWISGGLPVYQGTERGKVLIRPADIDAFLTRTKKEMPAMSETATEILIGLGLIEGASEHEKDAA